jgi:hypothetical protein
MKVTHCSQEMTMELDTELHYYEAHQADLLKTHRGQVALIQGETVVGTFSTEEEAYRAGSTQLGSLPFLVVRIEEGPIPYPTGQQLLRHQGFLAHAGMSDEDIEQLIDTIYEERAHQHPRDVDVE